MNVVAFQQAVPRDAKRAPTKAELSGFHMGHGAARRHVQVGYRANIGALRRVDIHAINRLRFKSKAE